MMRGQFERCYNPDRRRSIGEPLRAWLFGTTVVLLLVVGGCRGARPVDASEIEAMVRQELPIGSSREQIEEFFREHEVRYFLASSPSRGYSANLGEVSRAKFGSKDLGPVSLVVSLNLDEHDRLSSYEFSFGAPATP